MLFGINTVGKKDPVKAKRDAWNHLKDCVAFV
jgi:hypothetical protein